MFMTVLKGNRVDLHCHLLPAVDDGPRTMDEALELARLAVADGICSATTTPHADAVEIAEIPERVRELNDALAREDLALEVRAGAELSWRDLGRISDAELDVVADGPAGARWVLLEAPLRPAIHELHAAADELRARGYGVLLAHPERCAELFAEGELPLRRELARGSRLQVSSSSLLGRHGVPAQLRAVALVKRGAATVMATDAHRPSRPPTFAAGERAAVEAGIGVEEAHRLAADRPQRLRIEGIAPGAGAAPHARVG
jgi:protein-tyrosine phosphatase